MSGINVFFEEVVGKLVSHLASSLDLSEESIRKALDSYGETTSATQKTSDKAISKTQQKPTKSPTSQKTPSTSQKTPSTSQKTPSTSQKCVYPFQKGEKAGQLCGKAAKNELNENFYCKTHFDSISKAKSTPTPKKSAAPKTKVGTKAKADEKSEELLDRVARRQKLQVKRNKWGNWVDNNTNIVFDRNTNKAVGNQLSSGKVAPLTKEQISICESENWDFEPPQVKAKAKNVPVQPPPIEEPEDDGEEDLEGLDDDIDVGELEAEDLEEDNADDENEEELDLENDEELENDDEELDDDLEDDELDEDLDDDLDEDLELDDE